MGIENEIIDFLGTSYGATTLTGFSSHSYCNGNPLKDFKKNKIMQFMLYNRIFPEDLGMP